MQEHRTQQHVRYSFEKFAWRLAQARTFSMWKRGILRSSPLDATMLARHFELQVHPASERQNAQFRSGQCKRLQQKKSGCSRQSMAPGIGGVDGVRRDASEGLPHLQRRRL